jgi:guanylate kinase
VMIFILPPDEKTLAERLGKRARDSAETVEKRLNGARQEIAAAKQYYDRMVINEDLGRAVDEVIRIIADAPASSDANVGDR